VAKIFTAMLTSFGTTAVSMASYAVAFTLMDRGRSVGGPGLVFPTDPLSLFLLATIILPVAVLAQFISRGQMCFRRFK
jgi:hypothetical protein